jgi:hypothetical protein
MHIEACPEEPVNILDQLDCERSSTSNWLSAWESRLYLCRQRLGSGSEYDRSMGQNFARRGFGSRLEPS